MITLLSIKGMLVRVRLWLLVAEAATSVGFAGVADRALARADDLNASVQQSLRQRRFRRTFNK